MFRASSVLLVIVISSDFFAGLSTAEVSSSYAMLEKHTSFKPDLKTEPIIKREIESESVKHPVYNGDEYKNGGRANIEPVKPIGPVIKHEKMLADQPVDGSTELSRIDNLAIPGYAYVANPVEVAYPDIPYAPGYTYDAAYSGSHGHDMYVNSPSNYFIEPDTSAFGLLWSQVPDSRTIVSYVGRTITWIFGSMFTLFLGSLLTVGICSYTNLCAITFNGIGPIHEEMRSLISPERLEKISNAADFVKTAINKYQKIQTVADITSNRRRRSILY
ncbi:uncharacterized protein LOC131852048 [Achroia grisella]|uniref:uncharacterized protein LOC131852048 n=1 Tax=Achroia grisella TaxID=688607 RepID=UPI0027D345E4|nr:uncharacterized protein LOC131852048 [Achroia grisella]XP_059058615.1 uncharacterized protein LOC131852048 [Achroia grisella]XP_059058616.1 uncharacterized protein LOC131852048 [Achroia grisella]XP_059058617.1 uncharacterized protein LOC131852048 [Achroia grisella]XP_059058618.1 uncharacterized protein LOC131852048 [Achroia grisella]